MDIKGDEMKALNLLNYMFDEGNFSSMRSEINEAIAELEEVQETIKNLKHNYDVQVEYNNTAYKNYINMVNSLEQRIKELEALQSRSCEGCKYLYINKHSEFVEYCTDLNIEIPYSDITTFFCNRYKPKEQ